MRFHAFFVLATFSVAVLVSFNVCAVFGGVIPVTDKTDVENVPTSDSKDNSTTVDVTSKVATTDDVSTTVDATTAPTTDDVTTTTAPADAKPVSIKKPAASTKLLDIMRTRKGHGHGRYNRYDRYDRYPGYWSGYGGYWGWPQMLWSDWGYGNNYADWWDADYVFFRAAKAKAIANIKAKTQVTDKTDVEKVPTSDSKDNSTTVDVTSKVATTDDASTTDEIEREQQQQQPECHLMERDEDMSWQEAASNCAKWGMQLANPNTASVESRDLVHISTPSYWIGASRDATTEGQWTWMDGSKVANFHGNAPGPNDIVDQNCIRVVEGVAGLWEAADCSLKLPFMCQKCVF